MYVRCVCYVYVCMCIYVIVSTSEQIACDKLLIHNTTIVNYTRVSIALCVQAFNSEGTSDLILAELIAPWVDIILFTAF